MTIREYLGRKRFRITVSVILLSIPFTFLLKSKNDPLIFLIVLLALALAYIMFGFFLKCPKCNATLASLMLKGRDILHISPEIKCCPKCGTSFDTEL